MDRNLETVINYMKAHWPSDVKPEWQVNLKTYTSILNTIIEKWTRDASTNRELVRIAGPSGSGKTTQILPAVEAYFDNKSKRPILVAARRFVEYHPYMEEIKNEYGEENLRKKTDEFSTIMMFLTINSLTKLGYDIILDVTLLDPKIESVLTKMLLDNHYIFWLAMIAVSPEITERFLGSRAWRHSKDTEQEFIRATNYALEFYKNTLPDMRIVLWNVWDTAPIYDGKIANSTSEWQKNIAITDYEAKFTENDLRDAKIRYLSQN